MSIILCQEHDYYYCCVRFMQIFFSQMWVYFYFIIFLWYIKHNGTLLLQYTSQLLHQCVFVFFVNEYFRNFCICFFYLSVISYLVISQKDLSGKREANLFFRQCSVKCYHGRTRSKLMYIYIFFHLSYYCFLFSGQCYTRQSHKPEQTIRREWFIPTFIIF